MDNRVWAEKVLKWFYSIDRDGDPDMATWLEQCFEDHEDVVREDTTLA